MNDKVTIYIVRHGESVSNVKGVVAGHADYELTEEGEQQARILGEKLKHVHFDQVFSSDLIRAKRTAELITLEKKLAIETTQVLRERNYGNFEGKTHKDLFALFDSWNHLSYKQRLKQRPAENAESDEEVLARFITFLREISVTYPKKTILVSTHGGIMHAFLGHVSGKDRVQSVRNAAWLKVESDGVNFEVIETEGIIFENES